MLRGFKGGPKMRFVVGFFCLVGLCGVFGWVAASPGSRPTSSSGSLYQIPRGRTVPTWLAHPLGVYPLEAPSRGRFDASGLTLSPDGKGLLTVNDKPQKLQLFHVPWPTSPTSQPGSSVRGALRGVNERSLRLKRIFSGKRALRGQVNAIWKTRLWLDLEGVTSCQGHVLMIAEQQRVVFRLELARGRWTRHPLPTTAYERQSARRWRPLARFSRSPNAGYEGIACDAPRKRVYLIQERQPRVVLVARLPTVWKDGQPLQIIDHFDVPTPGLPRYEGSKEIPPDFAGGHVHDGSLYLLSRNEYAVLRVDPVHKRLLGRVLFRPIEKRLYVSHTPYGLAEGLVVTDRRIWIAFDNNARARRGRAGDRRSLLLELARPNGF